MSHFKNIPLLFSACCTVFAASSFANEATLSNFSYDYVEARLGASPTTYGVGMVFSVHPNAHIRAEIDTEFESDFDATVAAGFHAPLNDWADLYGEFGWRSTKQDSRFNGDTEFGIELLIGARQWIGPQLEVSAELGHVSINDDDDIFGGVSGRFHATELFSIGAQFRINDAYDNQLLFTTRFKF